MFPVSTELAPDKILSDTPSTVGSWFWDIFGLDERQRFYRKNLHLVESGAKIDLDAAYRQMGGILWHRLRVASTVSLMPILLLMLVHQIWGAEVSSSITAFAMSSAGFICVIFGFILFIKTLNLPFRKSNFIKAPLKDETYAFLVMIGGERVLRRWYDEFPGIRGFVNANKLLVELSVFEYELVEAYVHNQRRIAKGL